MESFEDHKILIVEDDDGLGRLLLDEVQDAGHDGRWVPTAEKALPMITSWVPDVVVSDLRLPGMDGLDLLRTTHARLTDRRPDFLIITAFGTISKAVEALKAGAEDFMTKPLDLEHFVLGVNRILEKRRLRQEVVRIRNLMGSDNFHGLFGHSRPMMGLFAQIRQLAKSDGPVLILGESGTGKELVARAIHREGPRSEGTFLAVNCAGIPEHLLESEFFGHEAGAFTGAGKSRKGLFAEAQGGTLLLDEISEMPLPLQAKLLRVLQDGKIRPLGGNRETQVDVRILAATHQDLEREVQHGHFRQDLFYRLETFILRIPPLREREEDIDLLANHFLQKFALRSHKAIKGFHTEACEMLQAYPFPGNVRELQNAVERAVTFCSEETVTPVHLPARIRKAFQSGRTDPVEIVAGLNAAQDSLPTLAAVENDYIRHVLQTVNGNKRKAANILGIGRRTLYRRLEEIAAQQQAGGSEQHPTAQS